MFFNSLQTLSLIVLFFQGTRKRSAESEEGQAAQGQAQEACGESWGRWESRAMTAPEGL